MIFLTADDDSNTEKKGLEAGAIDAKDTYTNGHSTRVEEYSRKIAGRAGMSREFQNDIYIILWF